VWALEGALRRLPRQWLAPLADLGGFAPSGGDPLFFSVIICDGNQTINNYSGKNTVTARGEAPRAWWAAQRPLVHRAEPSVVGGATPYEYTHSNINSIDQSI